MSEPAQHIRADAANWISRRDGDGWNESAQAELDAWLAASPSHVVAFLRAEAAWTRADKLVALKPQPTRRFAETIKDVLPNTMRAVAAAAIIAVVGVAANTYFTTATNEKTYSTPVGGRETITLVDGSQIALNTDTTLRMDLSGADRRIWLDKGEAYFHVTHNAARPFRVIAGNRTVTDLGTRFTVRRDTERFEVAVMEGKVAFEPGKADEKPIDLLPGDVAVATATNVSVTKKPSRALAESLGWQRGLLIFDNTTLADAAAEFNRYNSEKLVIAKSAARLPVVGTFRANDAEAFARVTGQVFGLHSEKRGQDIVITH
ncbi:MAG TPA: FecR domain-containing protein [Rhizomicrobium sp.]|nr:FecR domain-containing protein [Rhizomicrobium sp.]